jgi:hypothetical protein
MMRLVTVGLLFLAVTAWGDDATQRDKLSGSWRVENSNANANPNEPSTWVLQPSTEGVHMAASNGAKPLVAFDCKMAQECEIKDAGHRAKVMIYFNGPKLIETETMGSHIVKRRFTVTGDGNTMELEVIPIEPQGKPETVVFKRVPTQAAKQ